jgi:predicted nucleotidyltransferase
MIAQREPGAIGLKPCLFWGLESCGNRISDLVAPFLYPHTIFDSMAAILKSDPLRDRLESFCRSHKLESLYVFGSRADETLKLVSGHGEAGPAPSSDVDIAVKLPPDRELSARQKAEMAVELEDLLNAGLVDLITLGDADPFLAVNVIRGERLFCSDRYAADEYELYILRRDGDLADFERIRIERIMHPQNRD